MQQAIVSNPSLSEYADTRLFLLQRLSVALTRARTVEEVAESILTEGREALGARSGWVYLLSEDRTEFVVVRAQDNLPALAENDARFPINADLPGAEVVKTGQPLFWNGRDNNTTASSHREEEEPQEGALAALPLLASEGILGALGLHFTEARVFTLEERAFIETISQMCALALERARAYDAAQREIAERKRTDEALQRSQERLNLALRGGGMGAFEWDQASERFTWTEEIAALYGMPLEAFDGTFACWAEHIHPDDLPRLKAFLRDVLESRTRTTMSPEFRIYLPDGSMRWHVANFSATYDDWQVRWVTGVEIDITDRKRADEERAYVMSGAHCLLWHADIYETGHPLYLRWEMHIPDLIAAQRFLPLKLWPGQSYKDAWYRSRPQEDLERCNPPATAAVRAGRSYQQEFRCWAADGTLRWLREDIHVETVEAGARWRAIGVCTDITEHKQAEAELLRSAERFRNLAESLPYAVWTSAPEGPTLYWNDFFYRYTGLTPGPDESEIWLSALHPDDVAPTIERFMQAKNDRTGYDTEYRLRRADDGTYRWFQARIVPIFDESGEVAQWIGAAADVDDYRRAQAEIGELNARLQRAVTESHHRIKNNLQTLAALVDMQTPPGGSVVPASTLERLGQNIRNLAVLHDLLTQESKARVELDSIPLPEAVTQLLPYVQAAAGARRITARIDDVRLPLKRASTLMLLFNELALNAVKHGAGDIEITLNEDGDTARLEVADDGPGFPEDFDPMTAANTGLELITSLAMHDLHGQVRFENRAPHGARVVVTFPLL